MPKEDEDYKPSKRKNKFLLGQQLFVDLSSKVLHAIKQSKRCLFNPSVTYSRKLKVSVNDFCRATFVNRSLND